MSRGRFESIDSKTLQSAILTRLDADSADFAGRGACAQGLADASRETAREPLTRRFAERSSCAAVAHNRRSSVSTVEHIRSKPHDGVACVTNPSHPTLYYNSDANRHCMTLRTTNRRSAAQGTAPRRDAPGARRVRSPAGRRDALSQGVTSAHSGSTPRDGSHPSVSRGLYNAPRDRPTRAAQAATVSEGDAGPSVGPTSPTVGRSLSASLTTASGHGDRKRPRPYGETATRAGR